MSKISEMHRGISIHNSTLALTPLSEPNFDETYATRQGIDLR